MIQFIKGFFFRFLQWVPLHHLILNAWIHCLRSLLGLIFCGNLLFFAFCYESAARRFFVPFEEFHDPLNNLISVFRLPQYLGTHLCQVSDHSNTCLSHHEFSSLFDWWFLLRFEYMCFDNKNLNLLWGSVASWSSNHINHFFFFSVWILFWYWL